MTAPPEPAGAGGHARLAPMREFTNDGLTFDVRDAGPAAGGHDNPGVRWLDAPEEHDYPAAAAYLGLIAQEVTVTRTVEALRGAPTTLHAAKDILRASGLPLLGPDNPHVRNDLRKIAHGKGLSPVLLVRGDAATGRPLHVADGYHRVCASYHTDENTPIPARIVDLA